ncbi:MAG: cell division protein FtsH, partial [Myxococcota bacterium]
KSLLMTEEEKRETAYHEAGHALVALLSEHSDPVHKVTIIPRGMALGVTLTIPERDRYGLSREEITAQIRHAMGGRAAEDLVFGKFTTGAANDLKQATATARQMICSYGMSDVIGPVSFGEDDHDVFLGRDLVQRKEYSEEKAREIDRELTTVLTTLYDDAKQLLTENRETLDRISDALLERETLGTEELALLLEGKPLPPLPALMEEDVAPSSPTPERETSAFPGENLPDPEPVPG